MPPTEFGSNSGSISCFFFWRLNDHGTSSPWSGLGNIEQRFGATFSALCELLLSLAMTGLSSFFPLLFRLLPRHLDLLVKLPHTAFSHDAQDINDISTELRPACNKLQTCLSLFSCCKAALSSFDFFGNPVELSENDRQTYLHFKVLMALLSSCLSFLSTLSIGLPLPSYCTHSSMLT